MDYDRIASEYVRNRRLHPGVLECLLAIVPLGPASRVLEVGCGTGSYLSAVRREAGCECFGCDPSGAMLAIAREDSSDTIYSLGRAESLDFPPDSFDLVFSVDVIHHLSDRPAYIRGAARVLHRRGALCTFTDSEWIIRNREPQSRYFPDTIDVELARYPRIEDIKGMMAEAGFNGIDERMVESSELLIDIRPFREKAFSSLHLITEASFAAGLRRMEEELRKGPIPYICRYVLVLGRK